MHTSVLLHESIDNLKVQSGDVVLDGTVGAGGHSSEICKQVGDVKLICLDMDTDALKRSSIQIKETGCEPIMIESNFADMKQALSTHNIDKVDRILLDLGLSSYQLDDSQRGFSFKYDEPLLMTMKKEPTEEDITALDVVNTWSEGNLADIIYGFGEERYSRRIAKAIAAQRKVKKFERTPELVECITNAVPASYRNGKINPATRTFQAIRIAVNRELEVLEKGLVDAIELLNPGGRLAVISFHSLEDRIVKNTFVKFEKDEVITRVTKKPLTPSDEEIRENPRSRSAKLRVIEKL